MTQQPSASAPSAGVVGSSTVAAQAPVKSITAAPALQELPTTHPVTEIAKPTLGAYNGFTMDGKARPKVDSSVSLSVDAVTGNPVAVTKPVDVPKNLEWSKPTTAVTARPGAIPKDGGRTAVATWVMDGDTLKAKANDGKKDDGVHWKNGEITCRLETINAPEVAKPQYNKPVGQPFGEESRKSLQEMILNKEVTIRVTTARQNNNRSVCQVEIQGKAIDEALVSEGLAMVYDRYAKDTLQYGNLKAAETQAKKAKKGVWSLNNPEDPEAFNRRMNAR